MQENQESKSNGAKPDGARCAASHFASGVSSGDKAASQVMPKEQRCVQHIHL